MRAKRQAVAFGVLAAVTGAAAGCTTPPAAHPTGSAGETRRPSMAHAAADHDGHGAGHGGEQERVAEGGLSASLEGITLWPEGPRIRTAAGAAQEFTFRLLGANGDTVREFTPQHEYPLHLVVVRGDLKHFQHLHPTVDARGVWSVPLTLPEAGNYRVMADFVTAGTGRVLATDLLAGGSYEPAPLPEPAERADVDGYTVSLARSGALRPGHSAHLRFSVTDREGRPASLTPVMGARGHLVALREADLAYLHAHPGAEAAEDASVMAFSLTMPSPGRYRLFLQFGGENGAVHTAGFTLDVPPGAGGADAGGGHNEGGSHHHSHR